jgi:thymidine phosphorylase
MVHGQGGPARLLEDADSLLPSARVVGPVFAQGSGYVTRIDTRAIGLAVVQLGGGRQRAGDSIDHAVGLSALCPVGQAAGPDTPLALVHAESQGAWERAAAAVRSAMTVGPEPQVAGPIVYATVTGDALDA